MPNEAPKPPEMLQDRLIWYRLTDCLNGKKQIKSTKKEIKKSMKTLLVLTLVAVLCMVVCAAYADGKSSLSATVFVQVDPTVSIAEPDNPVLVNGGHVTNEIEVDVPFRVEANQQELKFKLEASDLFLAGDPTTKVPAILVDVADIEVTHGSVKLPKDNDYTFADRTTGDPIDGFPTFVGKSEVSGKCFIPFVSSQNGKWDQRIDANVSWKEIETALTGQYVGKVRLTASLLDN